MGAIFRNGGFSIDLTHHAFHVLGSRILGFVQELYNDSEKLADTPEMMAVLAEQMADEFPRMTEIATAITHGEEIIGSGCDDQFEFEFGLDLILDGLEQAPACATQPDPPLPLRERACRKANACGRPLRSSWLPSHSS
jgi:hypothetical protein